MLLFFYIFNEAYLQELHNYIMCISYLIFQNLIFVFYIILFLYISLSLLSVLIFCKTL